MIEETKTIYDHPATTKRFSKEFCTQKNEKKQNNEWAGNIKPQEKKRQESKK
jgi:hypothetical protein